MIDCYERLLSIWPNCDVKTVCWVMSYCTIVWCFSRASPTDTRDHRWWNEIYWWLSLFHNLHCLRFGQVQDVPSQRNDHCIVGKSNVWWEMSWTTRSCNKDKSWLMIVIKRNKGNSRTQHKFAEGHHGKMMTKTDKACWSLPGPGADSTHVLVRTAAAVHVPPGILK